MRVIAVMPAFHEASRIRMAVLGIRRVIPDVIVVDDGSEDQTAQIAEQAGAMVVRHAINRGQGAALKTGTLIAIKRGAEIIVHVDADGQHLPESLNPLIQPIQEGRADVVFGSRFLGPLVTIPRSRRWLLSLARWFNILVLGIPHGITDPQSGLRAFRVNVFPLLDFQQDRMAHCSEILRLATRGSLRWEEVPINVTYTEDLLRKGQKSSDAFRIVWELFFGLFH